MTSEQRQALIMLHYALTRATECSLLDIVAADVHPDHINTFCDEVRRMREALHD